MLLGTRLGRARGGRTCPGSTASTPATPATRRWSLLLVGAWRNQLQFLELLLGSRLALLLPTLLAALGLLLSLLLLLLLLGPFAALGASLFLTAAARLLLTASRPLFSLPLVAADLAGLLLELADLLLHEAARLLFVARTALVPTAVRAALPPLGVCPFAAGAED